MRIVILERFRTRHHPPTYSLLHTLREAGHQVLLVKPGSHDVPNHIYGVGKLPRSPGQKRRQQLNRWSPINKPAHPIHPAWNWFHHGEIRNVPQAQESKSYRERVDKKIEKNPELELELQHQALIEAVEELNPDLIYPTGTASLELIKLIKVGRIVRNPTTTGIEINQDLIWRAPRHPAEAGPLPRRYGPNSHVLFSQPREGTVIVLYRHHSRSPGRFLSEGFRQLGLDVFDPPVLNWSNIDNPYVVGVVIVESVLPPLQIVGENPGIPVVFWVHHGEHHLATNLRLQQRYQAQQVLLAHSWHLSHRFSVPVDRLPFGVPESLFSDPIPWHERQFDVAMVGSNLRVGGPHSRRQQLLSEISQVLGEDRIKIAENVSPEEMAQIYANSRIVINDGGTRHFPITMRVFEAIGAGALLLTDPIPGLDLLLKPGAECVLIEDPVADQVQRLLSSPETEQIAQAGYMRGRSDHGYHIRAADLMSIFEELRSHPSRIIEYTPPPNHPSPLTQALIDDVDSQRILVLGKKPESERLSDRDLWEFDRLSKPPIAGNYETVWISDIGPEEPAVAVLKAATRRVYLPSEWVPWALSVLGRGEVENLADGSVITLARRGYRSQLSHPDLSDPELGDRDLKVSGGKLFDLAAQPDLSVGYRRVWIAPENYYQDLPPATSNLADENQVPTVSVVIPAYNRPDSLEKTLAGLVPQTYPSSRLQVVVADDGSEEDLSEVVERYRRRLANLVLVRRDRMGFGAGQARNLGAENAEGELLVFIDSDCLPHPDLVKLYVGWHTRADNLVVMGPRMGVDTSLLAVDEIGAGNVEEWFDHLFHPHPELERRRFLVRRTLDLQRGDQAFRAVVSSNFSMSKLTFELSGGFSTDFHRWGGEDIELGWRLYQQANTLVWEEKAVVLHQIQEDRDQADWREEELAKNQGIIATKIPHRFYRIPKRWFRYEVPKVSWILYGHNPENTEQLISQIGRQQSSDWELIVVGTNNDLRHFSDLLSPDDSFSFASDLIKALGDSRGEYVCLWNPAVELDPALANRAIRALERSPRYGIVRAPYLPDEEQPGSYRSLALINDVDRRRQSDGLPLWAMVRKRDLAKALLVTRSPGQIWQLAQTLTEPLILEETPLRLVDVTEPIESESPDTTTSKDRMGDDPTDQSKTYQIEANTPTEPPFWGQRADETPTDLQPIEARYVGWTGNQNLGDEALYLSIKQLLSWAQVNDRGPVGKLLILGGGTLINRGYLKHLAPHDIPRVERVIFGTGVANPKYWGTPWEQPEEWLEFLSTCAFVGVRGPLSAQILVDWGWEGPLEIIGDPALILQPSHPQKSDPERVLLCPAWTRGKLWGDSDEKVQAELAVAVTKLTASGFRVEMLSANPNDDRMNFEILRASGHPDLPYHPGYRLPIENVMNLLSSMRLVIAERLHGAVLAAAAGTPFVGLEYRPKIVDFAASLTLEQMCVRTDELDSGRLVSVVTDTDWTQIKTQMDEKVSYFRDRLQAASQQIHRIMQER